MPGMLVQLRGPEKNDKLRSKSVAVMQLIDPPRVPLKPIVKPTRVTVTAVPAASAAPEAAKTMEVAPGCAGVRLAPTADDVAVGVEDAAKKPVG